MNDDMASAARTRWIVWLLVLSVILGFSLWKADENHRDREQQQAYSQQIKQHEAEGAQEYSRLKQLRNDLRDDPNARRRLEQELNNGRPFDYEQEGRRDIARWYHPEYGIRLEFRFEEDRLVGTSMRFSTSLIQASLPQPLRFSRTSSAEAIRRRVPTSAAFVWLAGLAVTIASRKYGLVGSEAMLAASLAFGAAHAVNPGYTMTVRGIFSNDPLFFAVAMYVASLIALAVRMPPLKGRFRFRMLHLLVFMTALAVLLAMGPLGYFAIAVFAAGAVLLYWVRLLVSPDPVST